MTGKEKCQILKQIRKEIADKNGIAFEPAQCNSKWDFCAGTCPKCEEEIRYLDAQLNKKAQMGGRIFVAGVSTDIMDKLEMKKEPPIPPRRKPWGRQDDGIYQTMGLMRIPESAFQEEWDEDDELDD